MKKIELLHFSVANKMSVNCSTLSSSCHFFCHLLESGLARINWIRAVDKICVEQLFSCKKCRAIACRVIAIRAVHPHSIKMITFEQILLITIHPKHPSFVHVCWGWNTNYCFPAIDIYMYCDQLRVIYSFGIMNTFW